VLASFGAIEAGSWAKGKGAVSRPYAINWKLGSLAEVAEDWNAIATDEQETVAEAKGREPRSQIERS
jgi:hypothetical protein